MLLKHIPKFITLVTLFFCVLALCRDFDFLKSKPTWSRIG